MTPAYTIAFLAVKIPGLVDFVNRISQVVSSNNIRVIILATSRIDVYSCGNPEVDVLYFTDVLGLPSAEGSIDDVGNSFIDFVALNAKNSMLWPDVDRAIEFDIPLPSAFYDSNLAKNLMYFFANSVIANQIDMVLFESPSNAFSLCAEAACRFLGVQFVGINAGRMPGRFEILVNPLKAHLSMNRLYETGLLSDVDFCVADDYIVNIDNKIPDYMKTEAASPQSLWKKYFQSAKMKRFIHEAYIDARYRVQPRSHFGYENPYLCYLKALRRAVYRALTIQRARAIFDKKLPQSEFVLYPTHLHPEASTSVFSADYQNELNNICQVWMSLRPSVTLVVKEHISNFGFEGISFYRKLRKMPGICLLDPYFSIKSAIREASFVVTCTSTAGFEALALGKPVFVLGDVVYNYVPWCIKISRPREIFDYLAANEVYKPTEEECRRFVAAYIHGTRPGVFSFNPLERSAGVVEEVASWIVETLSQRNVP